MSRVIISDLGGVIVRVCKKRMGDKLAHYSLLSSQEILSKFSNVRASEFDMRLITGLETPEEFFQKCVREFKLSRIDFETFRQIYTDIFELVPETADVLKELSKTRKIILLSNTDALHYEFCEKKFNDVFSLFSAKALSFELHSAKPDRKIYLEALKMSGEQPEKCVYIDDIEEYVEAARKEGMHGIHFKTPQQFVEEIKKIA